MTPPENSTGEVSEHVEPEPDALSDSTEEAPLIGDDETLPSVESLSQQVVSAVRALNTLAQLALAESTARLEARRQVSQLALGLTKLAGYSASLSKVDERLGRAWQTLAAELTDLTIQDEPSDMSDDDEVADANMGALSDEEVSRRLGLTIPSHLRLPGNQEARLAPTEASPTRRVLIASLETNGDAPLLINQAASSFPRDHWSVTNLGGNVPIMALTGTVMETRPSVLTLVMGQGEFVSETGRLIADLRRQLFGLRIVAVGPALSEPHLAERLRLDLFSAEATKAADLASQFFDPLNKLGQPLRLAVELSETQPLVEQPKPNPLVQTEGDPIG